MSIIGTITNPGNIVRAAVSVSTGAIVTQTMSNAAGPLSWPTWLFVAGGSLIIGAGSTRFAERCIHWIRGENPPQPEEPVDLGIDIEPFYPNRGGHFENDEAFARRLAAEEGYGAGPAEPFRPPESDDYIPQSIEEQYMFARDDLIDMQREIDPTEMNYHDEENEEAEAIRRSIVEQTINDHDNDLPQCNWAAMEGEENRISPFFAITDGQTNMDVFHFIFVLLSQDRPTHPFTRRELSPEILEKIRGLTGIPPRVFLEIWNMAEHRHYGPKDIDPVKQAALRTNFRRVLFHALLMDRGAWGNRFNEYMKTHVEGWRDQVPEMERINSSR